MERTFAASPENGKVTKEKAKLPTEVVKEHPQSVTDRGISAMYLKEFDNVVTRNLV